MAYDIERERLVLFGGVDAGLVVTTKHGDTWELAIN
jgi:hypothetical protein